MTVPPWLTVAVPVLLIARSDEAARVLVSVEEQTPALKTRPAPVHEAPLLVTPLGGEMLAVLLSEGGNVWASASGAASISIAASAIRDTVRDKRDPACSSRQFCCGRAVGWVLTVFMRKPRQGQ
ncbi:hypothetical protein ASE45_05185 [Lysobacter sp. Root96]|nr:hypothetical protein ASE45_05185 [Lysobacter sp. Root96]